jgi:hypothetical protein
LEARNQAGRAEPIEANLLVDARRTLKRARWSVNTKLSMLSTRIECEPRRTGRQQLLVEGLGEKLFAASVARAGSVLKRGEL